MFPERSSKVSGDSAPPTMATAIGFQQSSISLRKSCITQKLFGLYN